jgi:hypothetical protein
MDAKQDATTTGWRIGVGAGIKLIRVFPFTPGVDANTPMSRTVPVEIAAFSG